MRFSLKWVLAGTVYVAIAAAAFGTGKWYYVDVLWAVALLAIVYAVSVAIFAAGKRRAMAATFVVGCVCFLLCVAFGGEAVPTERLLFASGLGQRSQGSWVSYPPVIAGQGYAFIATQPVQPAPLPSAQPATPSGSVLNLAAPPYTPAPTPTPMPMPVAAPAATGLVDISVYVRAGNAVATLAFGLIGSMLGLAAWRSAAKGRE